MIHHDQRTILEEGMHGDSGALRSDNDHHMICDEAGEMVYVDRAVIEQNGRLQSAWSHCPRRQGGGDGEVVSKWTGG